MIPVVDFFAWKLIQFSGLIQGLLFDFLTPKSGSIMNKWNYIQRSMSGYALSRMSPGDVPPMMRQRLLNLGRILLLVIVGLTLYDVLR